jgi:hypothetical protein
MTTHRVRGQFIEVISIPSGLLSTLSSAHSQPITKLGTWAKRLSRPRREISLNTTLLFEFVRSHSFKFV